LKNNDMKKHTLLESPKLSKKQKILSWICKKIAGDEFEERATNLLPEGRRIKGLRLKFYNFFARMRYKEGQRLFRKYGTHSFTD